MYIQNTYNLTKVSIKTQTTRSMEENYLFLVFYIIIYIIYGQHTTMGFSKKVKQYYT